MKCPECGKEMEDCTFYDRYDSWTDETYHVFCNYHACSCGYMDISNEAVRGELMLEAKEKRWSEWIFSQIASFQEIEEKFIGRADVISMIKNYKGKKIHPASKDKQIEYLDKWCLHFVLFGQKYYLKKSVEKYLYCANGLFPLKEGI